MTPCSSLYFAAQTLPRPQTTCTQGRGRCSAAPTSRLAALQTAGAPALRLAAAAPRRHCRRSVPPTQAYLKQHDSSSTTRVTEQIIAALNAHDVDKLCSYLAEKVGVVLFLLHARRNGRREREQRPSA